MALSAPLFRKKTEITVEVETTKGTVIATTPIAALVYNLKIDPGAPFIPRPGTSAYFGHSHKGVIGERIGKCTFDIEMRGDGTNAMEAALSAILTACGFKNTAETYTPTSAHATHETLTVYVYEDGVKKGLRGAMGNISFQGKFGNPFMGSVELMGAWIAPTDAALPDGSPETEDPPTLGSATFTIATLEIKVANFGINMNNVVIPRADFDAVGGLGYYMITDRDPAVSMDPEADKIAGYDINGIWLAGTTGALSLVFGSGAGKEITITAPAMQYKEIPEGERDGVLIYDVNAQLNNSSGDDELSIAVATS